MAPLGWFERRFGHVIDWLLGYDDPTFPRDAATLRLLDTEEHVEVFDPIADPADAWDRQDTRLPSVEGSGSKSPLGGRVSSFGPVQKWGTRANPRVPDDEPVPYWPVD